MSVFYIFNEHEDAIARDIPQAHEVSDPSPYFDALEAVEQAIKYFWDNCDGYGWMTSGFRLWSLDESGLLLEHEIPAPDFYPCFYPQIGVPVLISDEKEEAASDV